MSTETITPEIVADESKERWRPIVRSGGDYDVSSHGRVRSCERLVQVRASSRCSAYTRREGGIILKQTLSGKHGQKRYYIHLCKSAKHKFVAVHRLVCLAFVGPEPSGFEVNHKDGNARNNYASNLEWVTSSDNHYHAARLGLIARGERSNLARLFETQVKEIRKAHKTGLTQKRIAKRFGVSKGAIHLIVRNKRWKHLPNE